MNENPVVELQEVYFTYGCHPVLDGVNFKVYPGESIGITGPNGAGKTTLLKLILGQLRPQKGRIKLFGVDSASFKERHRIGYVSQNARHFNKSFPATAREVVASGRVAVKGLFRWLKKDDYRIVDEVLDLVGMLSKGSQRIGTMSGGQQQRVLLARALAAEPRLLILDEPTAGLDASGRNELYGILARLNKEKKVTLLLVSHDVEEVSWLITRQVCLNKTLCSCQKSAYSDGRNLVGEPCAKTLATV